MPVGGGVSGLPCAVGPGCVLHKGSHHRVSETSVLALRLLAQLCALVQGCRLPGGGASYSNSHRSAARASRTGETLEPGPRSGLSGRGRESRHCGGRMCKGPLLGEDRNHGSHTSLLAWAQHPVTPEPRSQSPVGGPGQENPYGDTIVEWVTRPAPLGHPSALSVRFAVMGTLAGLCQYPTPCNSVESPSFPMAPLSCSPTS